MTRLPPEKELKEFVFKSHDAGFAQCLWPQQSKCPAPVVKAHSIQRRGTLESLAENGHVVMPKLRFKDPPELLFSKTGIKKATTFTGMCSYHDKKLFASIDDEPLDLSNQEQMFLLAYRSVLRETHSSMRGARNVQGAFEKGVDLGFSNPNQVTPEMLLSTDRIMAAYDRYLFKSRYDTAYLKSSFGEVEHTVLKLDATSPSLAASTLFSVKRIGREEAFAALNLFPYNDEHVLAFSYFKEHHKFIEPMVS